MSEEIKRFIKRSRELYRIGRFEENIGLDPFDFYCEALRLLEEAVKREAERRAAEGE